MKTLCIIRNIILVSRTKWAAFNWSFAFYLDFRKEKPSLIFEILQRLSELRRFDMAVMFMSESEKKGEFYKKSFSFILMCSFIQQMIGNIYWMSVMYKVHAI